jgi:hypothetical protein
MDGLYKLSKNFQAGQRLIGIVNLVMAVLAQYDALGQLFQNALTSPAPDPVVILLIRIQVVDLQVLGRRTVSTHGRSKELFPTPALPFPLECPLLITILVRHRL